MSSNMLGDLALGSAMLGADPDIVAVDAGTAVVHTETRVSGSLSYAVEALHGSVVSASTSVAGALADSYVLHPHVVTAGTTVTAIAPLISNLRGQIATSTSVAGPSLHLAPAAMRGTVSAKTTPHGILSMAFALSGSIACRTSVTANLTKPVILPGGTVAAGTTVVGDAIRSILRGSLSTRTSVAAHMNVQGLLNGATIAGKTIVVGGIVLHIPVSTGAASCGTVVTGRVHVYPEDFQDVHISTHTSVVGQPSIAALPTVSTIAGRTTVTAAIRNRLKFLANVIAASTRVVGNARHGFGADIITRSRVRSALGIKTGIHSFSGQTIHCKTSIVAQPPENRFHGRSACGTVVANHGLTIGYAVIGNVICSTVFHSHFGGRHPSDGPIGSVNLTAVPRGDMGIPAEIDGGTSLTGVITVERHRMMVIFGNAGVSVDRTLVVNGTAIAGTGTRYVGEPIDFLKKIERTSIFYV